MKTTNWVIIAMLLVSCNSRKPSCDTTGFKDLNLFPVSSTLKLPAFVIIDTIKYGDLDNIFEHKVKSADSSFVVFAGVKSYEKNPDAMPVISHRMSSEKEHIEFWSDSLMLITETVQMIDTIKVGYLKYLDTRLNKNRYEARIFFYKGKRLVDIWLFEKYTDEKYNKHSVIDCVLENLKIN